MKMRDSPRLSGNFAPAIHQNPADKPPRALLVPKVTRQRAKKHPHDMIERVDLILQGLPRAQQIAGDFAVNLQEKTRFGLVIGVISREKIGKQFTVLINRIDRVAEKTGIAAEFSYGLAI